MELDFKGIRITIVSTPFDLLASCRTLSMVAQATFDIDVDKGGDLVIFVSKKKIERFERSFGVTAKVRRCWFAASGGAVSNISLRGLMLNHFDGSALRISIASSTGAHYGEARVAPFTKANTSSASILTDTAAKKFARS